MSFIAKALVFGVTAQIVKRGFNAYDAWKYRREIRRMQEVRHD